MVFGDCTKLEAIVNMNGLQVCTEMVHLGFIIDRNLNLSQNWDKKLQKAEHLKNSLSALGTSDLNKQSKHH